MADLASWNDGPAKAAVLELLERMTTGGAADSVPPAARVAVLDNDGTLWCERPAYVQECFTLDRLREQFAADPDLAADPVVEALLAGDQERAAAGGHGIVVDHDDDVREYAYESRSATDPDAEPILVSAARFGRTVASMKRDRATVFGAGMEP